MITIPNHTAEWLTDESFRQFRVINRAWARVYKSACAGNVLTWSKCGLTYVLTDSFYEADALQITVLRASDEWPLSHQTIRNQKEFIDEVAGTFGVNVERVR